MSKKFNYSKQYNNEKENEFDNGLNPISVETEEQKTVETEEQKPVTFGVANCGKLNVRKDPSKSETPVCVIKKGDKLTIKDSIEEWYKVTTESGEEGYCMSEFIDVK